MLCKICGKHYEEEKKIPTGDLISEPQRKRLFAIAMGANMPKEYFKEWLLTKFNIDSSNKIPKAMYEEICEKAKEYMA